MLNSQEIRQLPSTSSSLEPRVHEETWSLVELLDFSRRRWLPIVVGAVTAGVLVLLLLVLWPPRYRASATLVVVPPRFSSDLKPHTLSLQGYQRLLESDAVVAETGRRLAAGSANPGGVQIPRLGSDLTSRIFVSRRADDTVLAPVLEAVAFADSGKAAATKANTWAAVFLKTVNELMTKSTKAQIDLIDGEYASARNDVEALENKRLKTSLEYKKRIEDRRLDWDHKLVDARQATEDQVAQQRIDSRKLIENVAEKHGLLAGSTSGDASEASPGGESAADSLSKRLLQLVTLRIQLAQTQDFLTLSRSISDEALWQSIVASNGKVNALDPVLNHDLVSQEVNPVHTELALRRSEIELEIDAQATGQRQRVQKIVSELERLQTQRSADLAKLMAQRALVAERLESEKSRSLQALISERDVVLTQVDRDISHLRDRFSALATQLNQAKLASAGENLEDVRLGSRAVAPQRPEGRHEVLFVLAGLLFGGVGGLFVAVFLELGNRQRIHETILEPAGPP